MKTTSKIPKKKASATKSSKGEPAPKIVNIFKESNPVFHKLMSEITDKTKQLRTEQIKQEECKCESSQMDDLLLAQNKALKIYLDAKSDVEYYKVFLQSELDKK